MKIPCRSFPLLASACLLVTICQQNLAEPDSAGSDEKPQIKTVEVTIEVTDAESDPVSDLTISNLWGRNGYFGDDDAGGKMLPVGKKYTTNDEGVVKIQIKQSDRTIGLLAYDEEQKNGALAVFNPSAFAGDFSVPMDLEPLVTVKGSFHCKDIGIPVWATNYIYAYGGSDTVRVATCATKEGEFEYKLPPWKYGVTHFGKEFISRWSEFELVADKPVHDFGKLEFQPTPIAKNYGKPLPDWTPSAIYGDSEVPKLEDFKGCWTFVFYFAFW